jgi:hypothetical protein
MAQGALSQTQFDAMLKELYPPGEPENVAVRQHPFLSMVSKADDFEGDNLVCPVYYELPAGRARAFATAQANAATSESIKWNVTQAEDHSVILIDALTIRASRSNRGAFVNARKTEIDLMLMALGNSASHALYRSGYGALTQLSADPGTGTTFVCNPIDDARFFMIGQEITASANQTGQTERAGGSRTVTAIDEDTGTITVSAAIDASWAVNDWIHTEGDPNTSTGAVTKIMGLAGWLPLTAPTGGDSHFGVDRSVHPTRLAGQRLDSASNSIEDNILELSQEIVRQGGRPDKCFISHTAFTNLVKSLGTKIEYEGGGGKADVGFGSVMVHTSTGPVRVYPDADCPNNRGYILQMNTWKLHHLDGFPHIDTLDGNNALRRSTADGIEVRARYWANLVCKAPGWNGVFSVS